MSIYHYEIEQGTPEWHELRRGIVTASVAAKLVTPTGKVAQNETVRQLAYTLAAEKISGRVEPCPTIYHFERGHIEEVFARDLYTKNYSQVKECGFIETKIDSLRVGYSPDGLVGEDGLIEIKSRIGKFQVQTIVAGEVPAEYMVQLQFGLMVSGREWIDFCQYSNGMHMFIKRVYPDLSLHGIISVAVESFYNNVYGIIGDYNVGAENLPLAEYIDHDENDDDLNLTWSDNDAL